MLLWLVLLAAVVFLYFAFRFFSRPISDAQKPLTYVMEEPPLPRDLAQVRKRLDRWKEEGRLGREEYERLMGLVLEDAKMAGP